MPLESVIRWCLVPFFPRSVGFGPIASPPFLPGCLRHPRRLAPSRSSLHHSRLRAGSGAVRPISQVLATHSTCANRSFRFRTPSPSANPPSGCPSSARTQSPAMQPDRRCVDAHHQVSMVVSEAGERCAPREQRAGSLWPSNYTMHRKYIVQEVLLPLLISPFQIVRITASSKDSISRFKLYGALLSPAFQFERSWDLPQSNLSRAGLSVAKHLRRHSHSKIQPKPP